MPRLTSVGDRATPAPLMQVRDLAIAFPSGGSRVRAVRGVDLTLRAGEVMGLVGESGSGKSATALALAGLHDARAEIHGSIRLDDSELVGAGERVWSAARGRRIGMIFQDPIAALNPIRTVGSQLMQVLRLGKGDDPRTEALALLAAVGLGQADTILDAYPHTLSGGMNQRVMIALALALEPAVLIADEPTTALDVVVQARILRLLRDLARTRGLGVLLITHDLGVVADVCDQVAVMYGGRIVECGPVAEVLARPHHRYTGALLAAMPDTTRDVDRLAAIAGDPVDSAAVGVGCAFAPRCVAAIDACRTVSPELHAIDAAAGHLSTCINPQTATPPPVASARQRHAPGETLIAVRDLSVRFGRGRTGLFGRGRQTLALDRLDLEVRRGEILGVVGESGSGKSTLARVLTGAIAASAGTTLHGDQPIPRLMSRAGATYVRRVQMVFQNPAAALDPRMAVGDQIAEPLAIHSACPRPERLARARDAAHLVGLSDDLLGRVPARLSGGQRQRVVIARALILEPEVLICDEPVAALDLSVQAQVVNLLADLRARLGLTLVFISHDLRIVRHLADRIAVLHSGRLVEIADAPDLFASPRHPYTDELLKAAPGAGLGALLAGAAAEITTDADPAGCTYANRCPQAVALCRTTRPPFAAGDDGHGVACHAPIVSAPRRRPLSAAQAGSARP